MMSVACEKGIGIREYYRQIPDNVLCDGDCVLGFVGGVYFVLHKRVLCDGKSLGICSIFFGHSTTT